MECCSVTAALVKSPALLIIDEDVGPRRALAAQLRKQGYRVEEAPNASTGLKILKETPVALALVEPELSDMDSAEVIRLVRRQSPGTSTAILTDDGSAKAASTTLSAGASDYFRKPIQDWDRFHALIGQCLRDWGAPRQREELADRAITLMDLREGTSFAHLKGNSPAMQVLMETIQCFGPLPDPILVLGESGVGKELVAQAIHNESATSEGPFLAINCAAIRSSLFESELFGHKAGSFTGADKDRAGLIESADSGTLFLDEVGELSLELQAKLLRVMEQGEYRRVGCNVVRRMNTRIVAATNVDLVEAISQGRFRQDLYFRLSGLEVQVPPLRERRQDVHGLACFFVHRYNQKYNRCVTGIDADALGVLERADWSRNNVRELEWTIRQSVARVRECRDIVASDLRVDVGQIQSRPSDETTEYRDEQLMELPYGEALKEVRRRFARQYMDRCLVKASYNKSRAAQFAGMQRSNLTRLLKELDYELPNPADINA